MDKIAFHFPDGEVIERESSHAPSKGTLVNIRKTTYTVLSKTYTVDYIDFPGQTNVLAIIQLG